MSSVILPIEQILEPLVQQLETTTTCVLQAPPGAGKTTRVPVALLEATWRNNRKILMLEPRRLAARSAAGFMAHQLGQKTGQTIGYRVRHDSRVGPQTLVEVVTEGVLTRIIQNDPELSDYACVIFDEFHERSLQADLGLALALECQVLRDDLRILVMSATLDAAPVAELMDNAPILTCEGQSFPVETVYQPPVAAQANQRLEQQVAGAIARALNKESGSMLVFLPGAGEIRRVAELLEPVAVKSGVEVHLLYGMLSRQDQDRAIAPAPAGTRKIVLATAIAETSLTIEGIRVVVDAGLVRRPALDPRSGMSALVTERVSRSSADQRRGRAGRVEPGVCYRLYHQGEQLREYPVPEVQVADLSSMVLELALWGVTDVGSLAWLDEPPARNVDQARELLLQLGALDKEHHITDHGRTMAALPLHPRLAHMVCASVAMGCASTGCVLAGMLEHRGSPSHADIRTRLSGTLPGLVKDNAKAIARTLKHGISLEHGAPDPDMAGPLLAVAYPDRVGQNVGRGRFRLSGGRMGEVNPQDPLARVPYLAVADLGGSKGRAVGTIFQAAPIDMDDITALFKDQLEQGEFVVWDEREQAVLARRQVRLHALVLKDDPLQTTLRTGVTEAVLEGIHGLGLECLPWTREQQTLLARVELLRQVKDAPSSWPDFPDMSAEHLLDTLDIWLAPFVAGVTRRSDFRKIDMSSALGALLPWDVQQQLNTLAPERITVPSGAAVRVDYLDPSGPVLPVKLQEMFGATQTPAIGQGRIPLKLHLLSPARRPLAVTSDLVSFWANGYPHVKAEMKGRYPKHPWPDDPMTAVPTAKTKRHLQR